MKKDFLGRGQYSTHSCSSGSVASYGSVEPALRIVFAHVDRHSWRNKQLLVLQFECLSNSSLKIPVLLSARQLSARGFERQILWMILFSCSGLITMTWPKKALKFKITVIVIKSQRVFNLFLRPMGKLKIL